MTTLKTNAGSEITLSKDGHVKLTVAARWHFELTPDVAEQLGLRLLELSGLSQESRGDLESRLHDALQLYSAADDHIANLKADLKKRKIGFDDLNAHASEVQDDRNKLLEDNANLKKECDDLDKKFWNLSTRFKGLEREHKSLCALNMQEQEDRAAVLNDAGIAYDKKIAAMSDARDSQMCELNKRIEHLSLVLEQRTSRTRVLVHERDFLRTIVTNLSLPGEA